MNFAQVLQKATTFLSVMLLGAIAQAQVQPEQGGVYKLPRDVSIEGHRIDWLLDITNLFALVLFIVMVVWMAIAMIKHNRGHSPDYDHGNTKHSMVVACTVSVVIFMIVDGNLFYHSVIDVAEVFWNWDRAGAEGHKKIEIQARQWAWEFRYPGEDEKFATEDDIVTFNELVVPVDTPIWGQMAAVDVLHSFYLPNLRHKTDAVPGMVNPLWFQAKETGDFDIACAQHCGTHHYKMKAIIRILSKEDYAKWEKEAAINSALDYEKADSQSHWGWAWQEI